MVERERKYEIEDDGGLPEVARVPGVSEVADAGVDELDAVYFDSPDLRLARSGITLRRREGGADEGWHLKLPAGPDSRTEIRVRLGEERDRPPRELADLVAGLVRDQELAPVARISTRRLRTQLLAEGGQVLAEVTDDHVIARREGGPAGAVGWREIEVELAEGTSPEVLDQVEELLLGSGLRRSSSGSKLGRVLDVSAGRPRRPGRKSTAGEVVMAYVREQVEAVKVQDILVRRGGDDAIHQLRVAIRKLRSALRVFAKVLDPDRTRRVEEELRWLGGRLSRARDLEVLEERFRAAVAELPDELVLGEVGARLTRHFGPTRADAERDARRALDTRRYLRLRDRLDRLVADPPLTTRAARRAREELPRHVARAHAKVARRMLAATALPPGPDRETAMHGVRKAAKRLRYAAECVAPLGGRKSRPAHKRVKAFTKVLGEFQDSAVAQPVLRELGAAAHTGKDNGFTFGLLLGRERAQAEHTEREIAAQWQRLATGKKLTWV